MGYFTFSENLAITFNNPISYVSCSNSISSNQPYYLAAICNDSSIYNVTISNATGNLCWSSENLTASINISIPSSVLSEDMYDLAIVNSETSTSKYGVILDNIETQGAVTFSQPISKDFIPDPDVDVLITSPNPTFYPIEYLGKERQKIIEACVAKGLHWKSILLNNCTWHNVASQLLETRTKYWINLGHGDKYPRDWLGRPLGSRTNIILADGPVYSYKQSDFVTPPIGYQYLGEIFETYAHTIGSLHFFNLNKLKIVFFDSCYSASYYNFSTPFHNDMAYALGMYSGEDNLQVYLGWTDWASPGSGYSDYYNPYDTYRVRLWTSLGRPDYLFDALYYAADFPNGNIPD